MGYKFIKTDPEVIPEEIMTGSIIKIYYEIRKDLSYTIKCIDAVTGNTLKEEVKENQTYNSEITEIAPKIDGFVSLNEQETITIGVEKNEIIFEYTDSNQDSKGMGTTLVVALKTDDYIFHILWCKDQLFFQCVQLHQI